MFHLRQKQTLQKTSSGQPETVRRLHGRTLWLLRALWLLVVAFDGYLLVSNIPAIIAVASTVCHDPTRKSCSYLQLHVTQLPALAHYGISLSTYAVSVLLCDLLITLLYLSVGLLIFWRKSDEWMGLYVSLLLITFAATGMSEVHLVNALPFPLDIIGIILILLQWPALGLLFYTFPDGRFVPRWSWLLALLFVINAGFYMLLPYPYNIDNWPPLLSVTWSVIVFGSSGGALIYRYFAVASPLQRQQIKWLAFGFTLTWVMLAVAVPLLSLIFPELNRPDSWYQLTGPFTLALSNLFIPLGIGIALLRYRLWDIDVLINRALVYFSLSLLLVLIYAGSVIGLQALAYSLIGQSSPLTIIVSTLLIAALFQPLRRLLQRAIDRRFYRSKYDAARVLAGFGARLHQQVELDQLSQQLVSVVQQTMQPAHISLWLCAPQQKRRKNELQEE